MDRIQQLGVACRPTHANIGLLRADGYTDRRHFLLECPVRTRCPYRHLTACSESKTDPTTLHDALCFNRDTPANIVRQRKVIQILLSNAMKKMVPKSPHYNFKQEYTFRRL